MTAQVFASAVEREGRGVKWKGARKGRGGNEGTIEGRSEVGEEEGKWRGRGRKRKKC